MKFCYQCGSAIPEGTSYFNHFFKSCNNVQPICEKCFDEIYWMEVLNDPNTVIIDGFAYCAVPRAKDGGFGNKEFTIQMKNGEIKRLGLWMNGKIPEVYRREDTAKFIV